MINNPFNPIRFDSPEPLAVHVARVQDRIRLAFDQLITDAFGAGGSGSGTGGGAPANARYWLSQANGALPNAVNMSALGAGILQQTVTGTIATPTAFLGSQGSVLFLGVDGTLAQDNAGFNYDTSAKRLLVNGAQSRGVRITVSNTNSGVESYAHFRMLSDIGGSGEAGILYTSSVFSGPQGPNRLVFVGPTAGNTQAFAWQVGGGDPLNGTVIARLHTYRFSTIDRADTTMFVVNPAATDTTGWAMVGGNIGTEYAMIARTGTAVATEPFTHSSSTYVWSSLGPIYFMTNGNGSTNGTPAMFVQYLASAATIPSVVQGAALGTSDPDGYLYISTMASAPVSTPTTQAGTGPLVIGGNAFYWYAGGAWRTAGAGTVTAVTATPPLFSSGGTAPNLTIQGSIVSGSASTSAQSLGILASGVAQLSISTGVATFNTFAAGAGRVVFGSGTAGALADSANLTWSGTVFAVGGDVTISGLGAGGIVKAAITTGLLSIATPGTDYGTVTVVTATAPIFITSTPTTTPNVTIQGAIVSGSASTTAQNIGALASGVAQLSISGGVATVGTFAATAKRVAFGLGTAGALAESANFTYDTSTSTLAVGTGVAINGVTLATNDALSVGHTTDADHDHVRFFVGGGAAQDTASNVFVDVIPSGTTVGVASNGGVLATVRIRSLTYTGSGGPSLGEATALYIDAQPTLSGASGNQYAIHVASGLSLFSGSMAMLGNDTIVAGAGTNLSFFGAGTTSQQTVTGSILAGTALANLLTALAAYNLIVDSTTP